MKILGNLGIDDQRYGAMRGKLYMVLAIISLLVIVGAALLGVLSD